MEIWFKFHLDCLLKGVQNSSSRPINTLAIRKREELDCQHFSVKLNWNIHVDPKSILSGLLGFCKCAEQD